MKILYIESKLKNNELELSRDEINKLPKKLFLAYTIQYKESAENVRKKLEAANIKVIGFQQVLGCSKINTKEAVLFIGTGNFHALNLFLQTSAIYIIDNHQIRKIPSKEIESLRNKRKTALIKYLDANNIGILVSAKPGQEQLNNALKLKNSLKKQGRQPYIFLSDNIDVTQFENFNIDSWVNTACTGLSYDNPNIINYPELP